MKLNLSPVVAIALLASTSCSFNAKNTANKKRPADELVSALTPTEAFNKVQEETITNHKVQMDLPEWETTVAQLEANVATTLAAANTRLDAIAALDKSEVSFDNTVLALEDIYYEVSLIENRLSVISATSLEKPMRTTADELMVAMSAWSVDVSSRKDIYESVQAYADTAPALTGEDKKLLEETLRDYRRVGFHLPDAVQEEIKNIKKELSAITTQIDQNIKEAGAQAVEFTKEELKGLSETALGTLNQTEDHTYKAGPGVAYQMAAIMNNATLEETRKKAYAARMSLAKASNTTLTEQVVRKRARLAKLLGYDTWADYVIEVKMAKTGETALTFVDDLIAGLQPKFDDELNVLRQLKVTETGDQNAKVEAWDVGYYKQILERTQYNLDLDGLKKYFSYDTTLRGMFDVFSKIFKLKIEFVDAPYVWDEKVKLVKISDSRDNRPLGFLYLDMFPRTEQEKYGHFAMFTVRSGKMLKNGVSRRPVAALICNFPLPTADAPSLLSFDNVETLFHEFGHALHGILTEAKYATFAGTRVARDFVEAPSQMLESWVHDKGVLDMFAVNYQDANDKIPSDILKKIDEAELATVGTAYRRQLSFGKMDLMMHQNLKEDDQFNLVELTNQVLADVYLPSPEGSSFITGFGHLFGGYDAGYYGYAWADNLSADMTSIFEASPKGFLDEEIGMRLREEIYQTGSTREITDSIEAFLGRPSNNQAFLKKLGIGL